MMTVTILVGVLIAISIINKIINNPNATSPKNKGLAVTNSSETEISIGVGYVAILKENGELWIWGAELDTSVNNGDGRDSESILKLAENVGCCCFCREGLPWGRLFLYGSPL